MRGSLGIFSSFIVGSFHKGYKNKGKNKNFLDWIADNFFSQRCKDIIADFYTGKKGVQRFPAVP